MVSAVRALEQAIAEQRVWFGGLFSEPLVASLLRGSSSTFTEEQGGGTPYPVKNVYIEM